MVFKNRTATLHIDQLEDRRLLTGSPLPGLSTVGNDSFLAAALAAAPECEDSVVTAGPKPCAPALPEWQLALLHVYAQGAVDLVLQAGWGQAVRDIYRAFLDGPFDLREYAAGHEVVEGNGQAVGFRASPVTRRVSQQLHDTLRQAFEKRLAAPPPGGIDCGQLPADQEVAMPIRRTTPEGLLTAEELRPLELALAYETTAEIPGIMAGGISDSMGVGMDDRGLDGAFFVTRRTVEGQTVALELRTEATVWVYDSIDFCPGGLGDGLAQLLTRPLQLLQANYWAQAVPFTVTFAADPTGATLKGDDLPPSCQGSSPYQEGNRFLDVDVPEMLVRTAPIMLRAVDSCHAECASILPAHEGWYSDPHRTDADDTALVDDAPTPAPLPEGWTFSEALFGSDAMKW